MRNWIIAAAILVFVAIGGWFLNANTQEKGEITPTAVSQKEEVNKIKASVLINPGGEKKQLLGAQEVEVERGENALELTEEVAKVETSGEGEMAFVTSINGRSADSAKNEFWELLINGESSQVGAGSYEVQDGDKIEWRVSTF